MTVRVRVIPCLDVRDGRVVKGVNFVVWDVGGQDKIRPLWRHYFQNTEGKYIDYYSYVYLYKFYVKSEKYKSKLYT